MASNAKLAREDLWSLEDYAEKRSAFRAKVMEHKKDRQVRLGAHATLYFEDAITMKYQVQEMLRVEKIFTRAEIEEELQAYNPLIPDGSNWKATFMIEYRDAVERGHALARMPGIEDKVWVQIGDAEKIYAVANEDLPRSTQDKAAAVHFMRFELGTSNVAAVKAGATVAMGIDHHELPYQIELDAAAANSLAQDLA